MLVDNQYQKTAFTRSEIAHEYGSNVHILNDPYLFSTLARFCSPEVKQPLVNQLLLTLYRDFLKYAVNAEFLLVERTLGTRMKGMHPQGEFTARIIAPDTRVVTVGLARAGTVPSQICFDTLNQVLNPDGVRQDHVSINRKTDAEEQVVGTNLGGVKIGGDINGAYVLFPDPMGATGSTIMASMDIYKNEVSGTAKKFIALHLIVTPEYLKAVTQHCPELVIYAIRLDRGLSENSLLSTTPGSQWDKERGLNDKQYIVPGAGGIGELINNSYV